MKNTLFVCFACFLSFSNAAYSFSNQVSAGIERWSSSDEYKEDNGFTREGDFVGNRLFAGYVHFLTPVEDNGEPLDLLPFFFARSNYVFGNYYTSDWEYDRENSDYTSEKDWNGFEAGGLLYLDEVTGIYADFFSQSGDWKDNDADPDDTYDEDFNGWRLALIHFLNDRNRLSISISQSDRQQDFADGFERSDSYQWLVMGYRGVLGKQPNIYLGANLGFGNRDRDESDDDDLDHDRRSYSLTIGPVYRQFAVYFSWDYEEWDPKYDGGWEAEQTTIRISPRYWFNEQFMLGGSIYQRSWRDWIDDDYEYNDDRNGLEVLVRYRF